MSQTLSIRLSDDLIQRIDHYVSKIGFGVTRSKCISTFLEEHLREMEFPGIEFRDTVLGRQAHIQGHMEVWQFIMLGRAYEMNIESVADHLKYPIHLVEPAFKYYNKYKEEIDQKVDDNENMDEEKMRLKYPEIFKHSDQTLARAS